LNRKQTIVALKLLANHLCYCGDESSVPEINRFFGVVVQMYYADHEPPHFTGDIREKRH